MGRLGRMLEAVVFAPFDLADWLGEQWRRHIWSWLKPTLLYLAELAAYAAVWVFGLVGWWYIGQEITPDSPSVSGNSLRDWLLLAWVLALPVALIYLYERRRSREYDRERRREREIRREARAELREELLSKSDGVHFSPELRAALLPEGERGRFYDPGP